MELEGRSGLTVRMEEEEGAEFRPYGLRTDRREDDETQGPSEGTIQVLQQLAEERQKILDDEKSTPKQKERLLAENRKAFTVARGGRVTRTDEIVMWVLIFAGFLIVILTMLTAFAGLSENITTTFIGTVIGGTIATITQKLGKL
jgi:hypothetical protein